ncbi:SGNH/GDSL hydrolase family protein [Pseudomonas aeruginosa]|uniref:SGNH/GDSL hydrolase family protein n=1 Tax=Pseudomonas aeruginosa TaxID=287 RepID=UPI00066CCFD3|nr:SGNH/GDSL hydrolase family protein [Pseudomonas aeruginosa]MBG5829088.1 SGNH/GDSL hydrolase family protein [Pseudomonas aeruginosa]MCO2344823.1 GDSL family lipase [Pseudomonas aeruginosa]MCO2738788.1 GDSL family lipase [Pseudomonas aeruginosa]MCU9072587.1 SGNH/GDSL hydrolase family protein [Pseudomonas aeruginosa]MCU9146554.1 SGNH/GDSL hydrolase family protein [Pseudomonas aeruginosa]
MRTLLLSLILGLFCAQLTLSATAAPIEHIYAFGDSYSDNGASDRLTHEMLEKGIKDAQRLPGELYWQGRWSNGPTAVEVLAQRLGAQLTDYAVGGAKSGRNNYYAWMTPYQDTGLSGQIDQYLGGLNGQPADPTALYFIFISANDFFEHADFSLTLPLEQLARDSVEQVLEAVSRLARVGAKRFMVVGSTELSVVPAVVAAGQDEQARRYQQDFNDALPMQLEQLGKAQELDIVYFDHSAVSSSIRSAPGQYGLSNLTAPCQPTYPEVKSACATPDSYYFWDEWHPTRRVHALVGEAMAQRYGH